MANTPTQIACGRRLYGDLKRLGAFVDSEVVVDLLDGKVLLGEDGSSLELNVASKACRWMRERHEKDGIPGGLVHRATLFLKPRRQGQGLVVDCETVIEAGDEIYTSHDTATWSGLDLGESGRRSR